MILRNYSFDNELEVCCDSGWDDLINNCTKELEEIDTFKILKVAQIKEKFGGLRYYVDFTEDCDSEFANKVFSIISKYEKESENTCELCGISPSSIINISGYLRNICKKCRKTT